jgi:transcriptional regulator with XRE-family HTH domain
MEISKNILLARQKKSISQLKMAELLNIEQSNYSRFERRGEKLTVEQLKQIADALGVGIGELLGIEAAKSNQPEKEQKIKELESRVAELQYLNQTLKENLDFQKFKTGFFTIQISANVSQFIALSGFLCKYSFQNNPEILAQIFNIQNLNNELHAVVFNDDMKSENFYKIQEKCTQLVKKQFDLVNQVLIELNNRGFIVGEELQYIHNSRIRAGY